MFFEDGAYVYKNADIVIVYGGVGVRYSIDWYGDLGAWELWAHTNEPVDVSSFGSVEEMFAGVCGFQWMPDIGQIDFIPACELPFEGHPPASLSRENLTTSISRDPDECPVLAWAFQMGYID